MVANVRVSYVILAIACLVLSVTAQQQNAAVLTLEEALVYAHQHSPRLAAIRQTVTTAERSVSTARAQNLPRIDVGASLRGSNQLSETTLGFPLTSLADVPEGQPFARGHLNAGISAILPIYTGGRITSATELARSERDAAQASVRDVERDLDFDVTSTYAKLVELDRDTQAAQESVNALEESRRVMAQMLQVGKVARVDLLKIDTRLADVQATLIEVTNARQIEAGQLNALLGRPIDTTVVVETALPKEPVQISPDQLSQAVASGNTKYQLAQAQLAIAERSLGIAKSQLRPSFSFSSDFRGQSPDPFSIYKGGAIAGFVLSFPLFNRPLNQQIEEAKSRELERREEVTQAQLDATQRARTGYLQVQNAEQRIQATQAAIGYAREALRIEQEKQQYGRSTIESLLDAQAALLTAEATYYRAMADYTTARAALKRETGI